MIHGRFSFYFHLLGLGFPLCIVNGYIGRGKEKETRNRVRFSTEPPSSGPNYSVAIRNLGLNIIRRTQGVALTDFQILRYYHILLPCLFMKWAFNFIDLFSSLTSHPSLYHVATRKHCIFLVKSRVLFKI